MVNLIHIKIPGTDPDYAKVLNTPAPPEVRENSTIIGYFVKISILNLTIQIPENEGNIAFLWHDSLKNRLDIS
jgi:hypothetical protein